MTTHIAIDDALINEALTLGHFETKEDLPSHLGKPDS